jgi:hypothetical protein
MLPSGSGSRAKGWGVCKCLVRHGVRADLSRIMTLAFAERCMCRVISHRHCRVPSPFPCRLAPSAVAATPLSPAPPFSFHVTTTTTHLPPSTTQHQPPLLPSLSVKIHSPSHPPVRSLHLAKPRLHEILLLSFYLQIFISPPTGVWESSHISQKICKK